MDAGTKIVRSCELVENVWSQIEELGNSLAALTESALKNGQFDNLRGAGSSVSSFETSTSGWNHTAHGISFPVMESKRRKATPTAWLNYQISVFGTGIPPLAESDASVGPVVHVSFWHLPTDFDDPGLYVAFPPEWDDWEIKDERLLFWKSEKDGQFHEWTFSIRLLDLHSEDALQTSIIEPIRALLAGAQVPVALPADLPGLVFYANTDQGASELSLIALKSSER